MKMNSTASYSTASYIGYDKSFHGYWKRLQHLISFEKCKDPYPGLRIAEVVFGDPYLRCADYEVISLAVMRLLMKYVYTSRFDYGKLTISYVLKIPTGNLSFTIGKAISLNDSNGNAVPKKDVYAMIRKLLMVKAEDYEKEVLSGLYI